MLATPSRTPDSASSARPPSPKITRGHSCILCQQRKVKCNRQKPCSNCLKARAECIPSAPSQPRRRRRKLSETDLATRLRKYEQLLRTHGVKIEDEEYNEPAPPLLQLSLTAPPRDHPTETGALFSDKQNSHYVENTLWENLRDEIQDPKDALTHSSDDEVDETGLQPIPENFIMGYGNNFHDLASLHPQPVQIFRMWQTFLINVNPLVKMFHAPTVQQMILDASGDLKNIARPTEALMFSIYFLSITSLQNEECESMYGESRPSLLAKYSYAAQQALINARFLKSLNLFTLQALILYLLAVRKSHDPHSQWVLSGVVVRIAQRLGLHRDGSNLKLSPFDAEIRRRTWWQIVFLDGHASRLAGAGYPTWAKFDTKPPLNISDSDISPTMKDPPLEKEGATEMIFCCLRYEVGQALRKAGSPLRSDDSTWHNPYEVGLIEQKEKAIDELEILFEKKFVRYCDPAIPLHYLVTVVAKSCIGTFRIMAHHPRQYPDKGKSMPQTEKDMLFTESLKLLEFDTLGHTVKAVQGYLWHVHGQFQMDAFIYILSELRYRTSGDLVDRAWEQIKLSFDNRPELITDTKNSLYMAVGNLTLKAWQKREEVVGHMPTPRFVKLLRAQRKIPEPSRCIVNTQGNHTYQRTSQVVQLSNSHIPQQAFLNNNFPSTENWGVSNDFDFDMTMPEATPVDWEYWQTLMDGDLPAYNGTDTTSQAWIG